ncbi:MAG: exonuclease domain-containing protein [Flavobacteriales bacterium]|nr:exonuclease domain-containing protein [Flavobacteriales bacterium]
MVETKSWFVRHEDNTYNYWNIQIHGIQPHQTENAPDFSTVWKEIEHYLNDCPVLVAHNAVFDMGCIRSSMDFRELEKKDISYFYYLRAAHHIYNFSCNTLDSLCNRFNISYGTHHRTDDDDKMFALLFLQERGCWRKRFIRYGVLQWRFITSYSKNAY